MLLTRSSALFGLLLASYAGHGQQIVPGYVVTAGQDSLRGAIVVHDAETQQQQVDFITAQGNQRQQLSAASLRAYGYTTAKDTVRYIAVRLNLGRTNGQAEPLFLRQLVGGPAELYQYRYSRDYYARPARIGTEVSRTPDTTHPVNISHPPLAASRFTPTPPGPLAFPPLSTASARGGTGVALLLRRRSQPRFVEATWWNFPQDAAAYFADCPALGPDLQANRYHLKNLPQLVRRYNGYQAAAAR